MAKRLLLILALSTPHFSTLVSMNNERKKAPIFLHDNLVTNYTNRIAKELQLTDTQKKEYKDNIQKWYFQGVDIASKIQSKEQVKSDLREHLLSIRSLAWVWYCMSLRKCKCPQKEGSKKIDISKDDSQGLMATFFIDRIWLFLKDIPENERYNYLIPCNAPGSHPQEEEIQYHQIPLNDLPNYANYILVGVDKKNNNLLIRFDKNRRDLSLSSIYSSPIESAKNFWGGIKSRIRKSSSVGEQCLGKDNEGPLNQISLPKEVEKLYHAAFPGKPKPYMYQAFQAAKAKRVDNEEANRLYELILKKYAHPDKLYGDEFPVVSSNILQESELYYAQLVQSKSKHIDHFYACIEPLFELDDLLFQYNHQDLSSQTQEQYTKSLESDLAAIEKKVLYIISEKYSSLVQQLPKEIPTIFQDYFESIVKILGLIQTSNQRTKYLKEKHFFEINEYAENIKELTSQTIPTTKKRFDQTSIYPTTTPSETVQIYNDFTRTNELEITKKSSVHSDSSWTLEESELLTIPAEPIYIPQNSASVSTESSDEKPMTPSTRNSSRSSSTKHSPSIQFDMEPEFGDYPVHLEIQTGIKVEETEQ